MTDFNQHYKERNPKETVALIQRFFEDKGFTILQPLSFQTEAGTWSARVELYDGNLMLNAANGKGMTYDYCQASAYAELYERFCNKCGHINNLAFMKKYMEISKENNGYYLAPGEKILSFEDVINIPSISKSLNTILPDINAQKGIFDAICDNLYVGVPYMNIDGTEETIFVDPRITTRIVGSCGLVAGNTTEEALNQGISELVENVVNKRFFYDDFDEYYEIDKQYICESVLEKITNIERKGYKIYILDLSYHYNYPVVASVLVNPFQSNIQINFGAFPVANIAIERIITELYQGPCSFVDFNNSFQVPYKSGLDLRNFGNNITAATYFNERIFSKLKKVAPNPQCFINEATTNKEILQYYVNKGNENGVKFYYTDNSLMDEVKAISIYSPELDLFEIGNLDKISKLVKRDLIIHLLREKKQIEDVLSGKFDPEEIYQRHLKLVETFTSNSWDGQFVGVFESGDWLNLFKQVDASYTMGALIPFFSAIDPIKINASNGTIFTFEIKKYLTALNYIQVGYSPEELRELSVLFDWNFTEEDWNNLGNEKYLFLNYWLLPFYNFYYSERYYRIVRSFMK